MSTPIDLPLSITSEIIKNGIVDEVCLSKNTKIAFSRIGGLFILYISNLYIFNFIYNYLLIIIAPMKYVKVKENQK